jgi:hypothetical protein
MAKNSFPSVAFPDLGSVILCLFDPGIQDHIYESLETIFWVKNTLMRIRILDPESF